MFAKAISGREPPYICHDHDPLFHSWWWQFPRELPFSRGRVARAKVGTIHAGIESLYRTSNRNGSEGIPRQDSVLESYRSGKKTIYVSRILQRCPCPSIIVWATSVAMSRRTGSPDRRDWELQVEIALSWFVPDSNIGLTS
jgi:hypothetical protein